MEECSICKKYKREIADMEETFQKISAERTPQMIELMYYHKKMSSLQYVLTRHRASKECTERQGV